MLLLCDEIFNHFPLFAETLRHVELCNGVISQIQENPPKLFYQCSERTLRMSSEAVSVYFYSHPEPTFLMHAVYKNEMVVFALGVFQFRSVVNPDDFELAAGIESGYPWLVELLLYTTELNPPNRPTNSVKCTY